jgi:hypothetical protein
MYLCGYKIKPHRYISYKIIFIYGLSLYNSKINFINHIDIFNS